MNKKELAQKFLSSYEGRQMIKALNEERNTECFWCDIWRDVKESHHLPCSICGSVEA